jgi:hypothetical protein
MGIAEDNYYYIEKMELTTSLEFFNKLLDRSLTNCIKHSVPGAIHRCIGLNENQSHNPGTFSVMVTCQCQWLRAHQLNASGDRGRLQTRINLP